MALLPMGGAEPARGTGLFVVTVSGFSEAPTSTGGAGVLLLLLLLPTEACGC